jgi:starvation-inducible DNA-binding protein
MKPNIGISDKHLKDITKMLTVYQSDLMILYSKTRKFHWNVAGESFMEYHKLFEAQYNELEETIDEVAERVNKLGANVIGTLAEYIKHATLKEAPGEYPASKDMVKELLHDHEAVIVFLRESIDECTDKYKDTGTADMLTGMMEKHETIAWTLRKYFK